MTIKELEYNIKEIQEMLEQKQKELERLKSQNIWKPEKDEKYYCVDYDGEIKASFNDDNHDLNAIGNGNCYKSQEKAEFEANCEKYTRLYRKFIEENETEKLDWKSYKQAKVYANYDCDYKIIDTSICFANKSGNVYASSEGIIKNAIEFIGEDNFKKYVLRVEE